MLIEKKEVSLFKTDRLPVDDVGRRSLDHVDELHIVVCMLRKMDEPGMGTEINEFSVLQDPGGIDLRALLIAVIEAAVNDAASCKDVTFFCGDRF